MFIVFLHYTYIDKNIYCVIKPPLSRGGRDIYVLLNNDKKKFKPSRLCRELHMGYSYFFKNFKKNKLSFPTLVTDYLRPPVYDVDILSFKGILKKIVIRKRKISSDPNRGHVIVKNKKISDYYINHEVKSGFPGWINLIGIESPGLTSCFSIAKYVKDLIE